MQVLPKMTPISLNTRLETFYKVCDRDTSEHLILKAASQMEVQSGLVWTGWGHKSVEISRSVKNNRKCMVSHSVCGCGCALSCWNQALTSLCLRRVMTSVMIHLLISVVIVKPKKFGLTIRHTYFQCTNIHFPVHVRICGWPHAIIQRIDVPIKWNNTLLEKKI